MLFLGGVRSGKSSAALAWANNQAAPRFFLAPCRVQDAEMAARVAVHKRERGSDWIVREEQTDLETVIDEISAGRQGVLLLDCLSSWISNLIEDSGDDAWVSERISALARCLTRCSIPCGVVSLETGLGTIPMHPVARRFSDTLSLANRLLAGCASSVFLYVAGLPLVLKASDRATGGTGAGRFLLPPLS